jgi:hypothetical protein
VTRPGPRTTGTLLAIAIAVGAVAAPSAAADPLGSARAQAAGLAKTVSRLQTQAEVATERYDGIEARLNTAVAAQLNAEQTLQSHQAAAAAAEQTMVNRARALYEGGGGPALLASLVTGSSPSEALNRFALASSVLAYERASDTAAATVVDQDASRSKAATAIAERVTRLQKAAARSAGRVQNLLNASRLALKAANGTVRRILTADQAAAAAAQARAFAEAVGSAGGTLDGSGSTTPPNAVAAAAIAAARTRLGDPYVWHHASAHRRRAVELRPAPLAVPAGAGRPAVLGAEHQRPRDDPPRDHLPRRGHDDRRAAHRRERADPAGVYGRVHRRHPTVGERVRVQLLTPSR